ncbi:hypothetical protein D3C81_998900 [compost metagenome]
MLGAAVVPDGDAVGCPAPAHLVLGDVHLAHQVAQQVGGAGVGVLAETHALGGVVVGEVGGEGIDEQHLLAGFRVGAHYRVLGIGVAGLERQALVGRHGGAEAGLDAVAGAQALDAGLDLGRQVVVGQYHVRPHGIAAHRRAFHATQHAAHRRGFAPGGVGVPGVFIAVGRLVGAFVDLHQPRVFRVAASDGVILQLTEATGKRHVLGAADSLVTQEQHPVLEQLGADLGEQAVIMNGIGQLDADQFGTNGAGQLFDLHGSALLR